MAHITLRFGCCPSELDQEQILDHLQYLKHHHKTPSESFFKHTVYGLRALFKLLNKEHRRIVLPQIERSKKLPVVLSEEEVKLFLKTPKLLKHRLILALLYDCGLRCFELCNVKLRDLDFYRKMLHVRQGKGRKDRYLPLGENLIRGLQSYIASDRPVDWLFNGQPKEGSFAPYTVRGVQFIIKETRRKCGIHKQVTSHTFRHSYATHLLEMGLDIISLKDALGHSCIETTLLYLHIAQLGRQKAFSPLDKIYSKGNHK